MCAAYTSINTIESQKKETNTYHHRYSTSIVVDIVLTCVVVGQTMTGSPQTRSSGQVRKSPRRNKVVQKTGKVRKRTTSASRRSLNGKARGKEIAAKPDPKVNVASNNVDSNDEVEEVDVKENNVLQQPMRKQIVSSREGALKRKKRPGKARKPMRVPKVHKSSSGGQDNTLLESKKHMAKS